MRFEKKIIVFDLCDVLVLTSYEEVLKHFLINQNHSYKLDKDFQYYQFSLGEISANDYYSHFCKKYCLSINYLDFVKGWNKFFIKEIFGIEDLLNDLNYYNLIILSNINELHANYFLNKYRNLSRFFTLFFFSYKLGLRKPFKSIYNHLISLSGPYNTREFIFIDDNEENIKAANKFGIEGVWFKNVKSLRMSLINLGIL